MDHLTLEQQIATELNPFSTGVTVGSAPTMHRETILMMLSQGRLIFAPRLNPFSAGVRDSVGGFV